MSKNILFTICLILVVSNIITLSSCVIGKAKGFTSGRIPSLKNENLNLSQNFNWSSEKIEKVKIDIGVADIVDVNFLPNSTEDFCVEVYVLKDKNDDIKVLLDEKTLIVSRPKQNKKMTVLNKSSCLGRVIIKCPQNKTLESLCFEKSLGNLEINNLSIQNFNLDAGVSSVKCFNLVVEKTTRINSESSDAKFENCKLKNLTYASMVGHLEFDGELTGESNFDLTTGLVNLKTQAEKSEYSFYIKGCRILNIDGKTYRTPFFKKKSNATNTISAGFVNGVMNINFIN